MNPGCRTSARAWVRPAPASRARRGFLHPQGEGAPQAAPEVGEPRQGGRLFRPDGAGAQQAHRLHPGPHLVPGVGPAQVGEHRVKDQLPGLDPRGQGVLPQFQGQGDLAFQGGRGKRAAVQQQQHQVGAVGRGQGQEVPEFSFLQGAGVEDGPLLAGGQSPGQDPGIGAVQHQGQAGRLLHRLHHEGHAVLMAGGQKTRVKVQDLGPGRFAAPGQFLQGDRRSRFLRAAATAGFSTWRLSAAMSNAVLPGHQFHLDLLEQFAGRAADPDQFPGQKLAFPRFLNQWEVGAGDVVGAHKGGVH